MAPRRGSLHAWPAYPSQQAFPLIAFLALLAQSSCAQQPWLGLANHTSEQIVVHADPLCSLPSLLRDLRTCPNLGIASAWPAERAIVAVSPHNDSSFITSLPCALSAEPLDPLAKVHQPPVDNAPSDLIVGMTPRDFQDESSRSAHSRSRGDFEHLCKRDIDAVLVEFHASLSGDSLSNASSALSSSWSSPNAAHVATRSDSASLARMLASLPCVHSVGSLISPQKGQSDFSISGTSNEEVSRIVQSGLKGRGGEPAYASGLRGENQIIAIGDTGADVSNCYLAGKTKIKKYISFANSEDSDGHGTHVACTALGKAFRQGEKKYAGVAKEARLVMFDLGEDSEGLPGGQLKLPFGNDKNLKEDMFDREAAAGATISSNSWGLPVVKYDEMSQEVDWFVWENNTMLPIFAAGNSGQFGFTSIGLPSIGKNALSVGATLSTEDSQVASRSDAVASVEEFKISDPDYLLEMNVTDPMAKALQTLSGRIAVLDTNIAQDPLCPKGNSKDISVRLAEPLSACNDEIVGERGDYVLLSLRRAAAEGCTPADALRKVKTFEGALLVNDMRACGTREFDLSSVNQAAGVISRSDGNAIIDFLQNNNNLGKVKMTLGPRMTPSRPWEAAIADFSSRGPTWDVRSKPDVVAPGVKTISAKAGTPCDVEALSGTSMATPAAAGASALVRQGLLQLTPTVSANFLKAAVINGAQPMYGFTRHQADPFSVNQDNEGEVKFVKRPMEAPPSCEQGFGRVSVASSLPASVLNKASLDTSSEGDVAASDFIFKDVTEDDESDLLKKAGEQFDVCVNISSGGVDELRATLVWNDFPGSLLSTFSLVNDLDLLATTQLDDSSYNFSYPLGETADGVNTAERMRAQELPTGGKIAITVKAFRVLKPQPFALVISSYGGNISELSRDSCSSFLPGGLSSNESAPEYSRFDFAAGELTDEGDLNAGSMHGRYTIVPVALALLLAAIE